MNVDPSLVERIASYLRQENIEPAGDLTEFPPNSHPRSLLVDKKSEEFPPSDGIPSGQNIMWAPPQQNWNAWRFFLIIYLLNITRTCRCHPWILLGQLMQEKSIRTHNQHLVTT